MKGDIKCSQCKGARVEKTLTGLRPCIVCNGLGVVQANMQPYSEWEAITFLIGEVRQLRKKVYLMEQASEPREQHDGRGRNNYRGD
ncbi:hypothetical protein [Vibrio phage CKB-S2]|nr:hypothetical protein [Vibrio phage CKB-S2]